MGSDKMIPRHVYDKPFTIRFPDRSEWKMGFQPDGGGGGSGTQIAPRQIKALELGCIAMVPGKNLVSALVSKQRYSRLVYAIKACAVENLDMNYKNRNIYIL
jgi:hypothetical protein